MSYVVMIARAAIGVGLLLIGAIGWWVLAMNFALARAAHVVPTFNLETTLLGIVAFSCVMALGWSVVRREL